MSQSKEHTPKKPKPLSRTRKPEGMSLEDWQVALRRDFAKVERYKLKRIDGDDGIFGQYSVTNPQTNRTYRVSIRGQKPGENFCSCPDYAVNTLGTCKHVEHLLHRLGRSQAGRRALAQGFVPPYSEIYLRYGSQRNVMLRKGGDWPANLDAACQRIVDDAGMLRPERFGELTPLLESAAAAGHDLRVYDDAMAYIAQVLSRDRLRKKVTDVFGDGDGAMEKLVRVPLYPYQREGALFAASAGRCLIADEMGLGKTIQAIAAAEILAKTAGIQKVLVICPTSLKHQWASELQKFVGRTATVVEGLAPAREVAYSADSFYKIVNYDVLHRDMEQIRRLGPDLVILDEAQRIKNWRTRAARSVKQIASDYAIVLTGTPLENRLEELHSIIEFVDRFRLGPLFRFLDRHQIPDENGRVVGYRQLDQINKTLSPVLLRRTKTQVLSQLPPRIEKLMLVPMTPQQSRHHSENLSIVAAIVAKWRRMGFLTEADQLRMRCALQNMRMSCDSTYLLDQETDFGTKIPEFISQLGEVLEQPDAKVVVFSQWLRMHELVRRQLEKYHWGHVLFHGQVPGKHRGQLVDQFRHDETCRVFLSTDAGGVGLNLQHASVVVNLDLPWNPAVLEQRIGRVHRLGQVRPVHVLNFVSQGTIEHSILDLLKFKRSVFAGALDGGDSEVFLGGSRLKQFMDTVQKATATIPAPSAAQEPEAAKEAASTAPAPDGASPQAHTEASAAAPRTAPATAGAGDLVDLLRAGRDLLDSFVQSLAGGSSGGGTSAARIDHDPSTGEQFVRLPLPSPQKLAGIVQTLAALLKG